MSLYTLLSYLYGISSTENIESTVIEKPTLYFTHYNPSSDLHNTLFSRSETSDRNPYITMTIQFSIEYLNEWLKNYKICDNTIMLTLYKKKVRGEKYNEQAHKAVSLLLDTRFQINKRFVIGISPYEKKCLSVEHGNQCPEKVKKTVVDIRTSIVGRLKNIFHRVKDVFDMKETDSLKEFAFQFNFKLKKRSYKFDEEDCSPWASTDLFSLRENKDDIITLYSVDKEDYYTGDY